MEKVNEFATSSAKQPVVHHKVPFSKALKRDLPKWLFMSPFIIGFSIFLKASSLWGKFQYIRIMY